MYVSEIVWKQKRDYVFIILCVCVFAFLVYAYLQ